ncbi:hypothetical protein PS667_004857, partial [Salmonella enterica]|nr:hypothetical protein [Salmonella enterica]
MGKLTSSDGNISISGVSKNSQDGISLHGEDDADAKVTISAGKGSVTLEGSSATGSGVFVKHALIDALKAVISGSSRTGHGFSLSSTTLGAELASLANVSLSSLGSGVDATNILDDTIVNSNSRDNLLAMDTGSMTTVNMNGTAIFNDSAQAWIKDYGTPNPNNGWIFNNTIVNVASADLKGVGFNHSNLTVANGSFSVANNASSSFAGNNITISNGSFSLLAKGGSLSVSGTNISATGDVSLQVNRGGIDLTNATIQSQTGAVDMLSGMGDISADNASLNASGDITLQSFTGGATLNNSILSSNSGAIKVTVKGGGVNLQQGNV